MHQNRPPRSTAAEAAAAAEATEPTATTAEPATAPEPTTADPRPATPIYAAPASRPDWPAMTNTTKSRSGRSEKSCELGARDATAWRRERERRVGDAEAARDEAGERADAGPERGAVLLLGEQRTHDVPANLAAGGVGDDSLEALPHLDPHVPRAGLVIGCRGTRRSTRPGVAPRVAHLGRAPTPQFRPIASATSRLVAVADGGQRHDRHLGAGRRSGAG